MFRNSFLATCLLVLISAVYVACGTETAPELIPDIEVSPGAVNLDAIGATAQLRVTVDGTEVTAAPAGMTLSITSSATNVVTVTSGGLITAVGNGTSIITGKVTSAVGADSMMVNVTVRQVPDTIFAVAGDDQTQGVNTELATDLVAQVDDRLDNPIGNVVVNFTVSDGDGSLGSTSDTTNSSGQVTTSFTLGGTAGPHEVTAAVASATAINMVFEATATASGGDAGSMYYVSGNAQTAYVNTTLPMPLTVRVVDETNDPVSDVAVSFSSLTGGGMMNPASAPTNGDGNASTSWILGSAVGTQTAQAVVAGLAGSPVSFSATGNAPPAGESEHFPPYEPIPTIADLNPNPDDSLYCSTEGSNTTGDGSLENPWYDLIGAQTGGAGSPAGPGDIIFFRAGTWGGYPYENFSRSENMLTNPGTRAAPIIITNYPGEIARWDYRHHWVMTLDGDWQFLVGTHVGDEFGIQINGGVTVRDNHQKVVNVEFTSGSYNGGDGNPAMLSVPLYDGCDSLLVSHNYFHDAVQYPGNTKMVAFRTFNTTNMVLEYNVFENNHDIYQGGNIYFKNQFFDAEVRYNKFINTAAGVSFTVQGYTHDGLDIHHNLFYQTTNPIFFTNQTGPNVRIHDNVALEIPSGGAFFYYLNGDNANHSAHGEYYDNVIDGPAFEKGWSYNADDLRNLPDFFDYNLWYAANDQNNPWGTGAIPSTYHDHAVVAPNSVLYYGGTRTATVAGDFAGRTAGRFGGAIGGFVWP